MSVAVVAVGAAMPTATRRLCTGRCGGRSVHKCWRAPVLSSDRLLAETGKGLSVSFERVPEGGVRQPLYRTGDVIAAGAPVGRHDEYAKRLEAHIHHSRRQNKKEMLSTHWAQAASEAGWQVGD